MDNSISYLFVFINGGWWLRINNIDELLNYHELHESRWGKIFEAFVHSERNNQESDNPMVQAIYLKADGKKTALQILQNIKIEMGMAQVETLNENGYIHLNGVGGHCSMFDIKNEEQWVRRKNCVFPDFKTMDIRVKQFKGGTHWYAYVGDVELNQNKDRKSWDTYSEAYAAAERYITI